jgi:hypothetical protein
MLVKGLSGHNAGVAARTIEGREDLIRRYFIRELVDLGIGGWPVPGDKTLRLVESNCFFGLV